MPERDELDRLIDSELARYAEPRVGLEQRILARIEAESSRRSWLLSRWRLWALAGAVVAIVLLGVSVPRVLHRETDVNTARAASPDHERIASTKGVTPEVHVQFRALPQIAKRHHVEGRSIPTEVAANARHPKLDVFPSPQPLSAQERALLALATQSPDTERETLLANQRRQDSPLDIAAIRIPPITLPDEGKN